MGAVDKEEERRVYLACVAIPTMVEETGMYRHDMNARGLLGGKCRRIISTEETSLTEREGEKKKKRKSEQKEKERRDAIASPALAATVFVIRYPSSLSTSTLELCTIAVTPPRILGLEFYDNTRVALACAKEINGNCSIFFFPWMLQRSDKTEVVISLYSLEGQSFTPIPLSLLKQLPVAAAVAPMEVYSYS